MSAFFTNASSQYLLNSSPGVTTFPFTVGLWVLPTAAAIRTAFSLTDSATSNNFWQIGHTASQWRLSVNSTAGGLNNTNFGVYSPTQNRWAFLILRVIAANNRRGSAYYEGSTTSGTIVHGQGTLSSDPSADVDRMGLGSLAHSAPTNFLDGYIAEFWYTNSDIQSDGAQLDNSMVLQLAFGGPFSVPHIAANVIEYHSMYQYPDSMGDTGLWDYWRGDPTTWVNNGGVILGIDRSLPYSYVRPSQKKNILVV